VQSEINFSMETALNEPLTLTLINAQGQTVLTDHLEPHGQAWSTKWDLSSIGNGVYVLKVAGQDRQLIKKIVKTGF
jgi:hypothetical protein